MALRNSRRIAALVVTANSITLGACGTFQDPEPSAEIEEAFPPAPSGAQLMDESVQDGKWRGDQPPPAISRRWLVDCATLDDAVAAIEKHFVDEGFVDDVDPSFSVQRYRRPSDGFRAGVESADNATDVQASPNSEGLSPDEIEGRCLIWATVEDSDFDQ